MYLSNSNDGSLLCFNGVNTLNTSSNVNSLNPRAVGTFNANGNYSLATSYTGTLTGNPQTRGSSTLDNTNFYIGDQMVFILTEQQLQVLRVILEA